VRVRLDAHSCAASASLSEQALPKLSAASTFHLARRLTLAQLYVRAKEPEGRWPQSFNRTVRIEDSAGLVFQSRRVIRDRVLLASSTVGRKQNVGGRKGYAAKFADRLTGEVYEEVFFDSGDACRWCDACELAALKRAEKAAAGPVNLSG